MHYRGGALQGHDHCTLFVTCCRHPVYSSSRTFPSTFLLFVWRQKLLICYHHFPVLARYTYLLLKDLVRYILNGDYLSRTLTAFQIVSFYERKCLRSKNWGPNADSNSLLFCCSVICSCKMRQSSVLLHFAKLGNQIFF